VKHPLLFEDLFDYVAPHMTSVLKDWDNTEEIMKIHPTKQIAHTSFAHCQIACEADNSCLQYIYDGSTCALSQRIRLGRQRLPGKKEARRYLSGWNTKRIQQWTAENQCASAHWVRSNP